MTELMPLGNIEVEVIIACYDAERLPHLRRAISSVLGQQGCSLVNLIVAVDHNEQLAAVLSDEFGGKIVVVENHGARGASPTRNVGARAGSAPLIAFLDDDAVAAPGWLVSLVDLCRQRDVIGAGGNVLPAWETHQPEWFPSEFNWVVGASIKIGDVAEEPVRTVRNVWAENMIIRRKVFESVGGFDESFGKKLSVSRPEDTELCIRTATVWSGGRWVTGQAPVVDHFVPKERASFRFFLRRCFNEGRSKALLARRLDAATSALSTERAYVKALMRSPLTYVRRGIRTRSIVRSLLQLAALLTGLLTTVAGFGCERLSHSDA